MQDKDFDQLFKQRFESFEVEPSERSWENISRELDGQKKTKRAVPSFWMAAASVIILASAVLWLYRPVEVIKLQGKADMQTAMNEKPALDDQRGAETVASERIEDLPVAVERVRSEKASVTQTANTDRLRLPKQKETPVREKVDPVKAETMLAEQGVEVNSIPKADVAIEESPVVVAQLDPTAEEANNESEPARQRIKSVGGLVNFVIAQVDRRDNKIIEFRDGEEGAAVSGINLGPIKFKSRNK